MPELDAFQTELIPGDYFRELRREEIFPDASRPLEIDAGCGDGTFLMEMAAHYPERDFLGIERLGGRVSSIVRKCRRRGLTNVRVLCLETGYSLGWLLPAGCASRLHLLFPDPWPKARHAGRRFIQPENLAALHRVIRTGGEFLFKTDHEAYYDAATEAVDASPLFRRLPWLEAEEFYPITDFEQLWLSQGCRIQGARWQAAAAPGN